MDSKSIKTEASLELGECITLTPTQCSESTSAPEQCSLSTCHKWALALQCTYMAVGVTLTLVVGCLLLDRLVDLCDVKLRWILIWTIMFALFLAPVMDNFGMFVKKETWSTEEYSRRVGEAALAQIICRIVFFVIYLVLVSAPFWVDDESWTEGGSKSHAASTIEVYLANTSAACTPK